MSFSSVAAPFGAGLASSRALLRGTSLRTMVRTMGTVAAGIGLAAGYQILYEEGRGLISRMRDGAAVRGQNNTAVMLLLLNKGLPTPVLQRIRVARDRVTTCIDIVTSEDETVTPEHREIIADVLGRMVEQRQ